MHGLKVEVTRFTLVGAVNFVLTFIVFTVMLKVMAMDYLLSLIAAWLAGLFFSYVLNFSWVFMPEETIQFKSRLMKYFLASAVSIVGNVLVLRGIVENTGSDPFYVQLVLIPVIVLFNYLTAKYWSLRSDTVVLQKHDGK